MGVAHCEVGPVAGAELLDVREEVVGGIPREDVGQARLDTDADQRQLAGRLPLSCRCQLLVAELDVRLLVGRLGMPLRQAHGHVRYAAPAAREPRKIGITNRGSTALKTWVAACSRARAADGLLVGGVDLGGHQPRLALASGAGRCDGRLGSGQVVVGDDEQLEEVALDGDTRGGVADAAGPDHEDAHVREPSSVAS